jgi:hypothetical protein
MDYKNGKWAKEILDLQQNDGSWGNFHCFSMPNKNYHITTGQAIRRLAILGFTVNDLPIKRAINYMNNCLAGKNEVPDKFDKVHDSNVFNEMMLAGWIKYFTEENKLANNVTKKWGEVINYTFYEGKYDHNRYVEKYTEIFKNKPKGPRLIDFLTFYQVTLLANNLDKSIESKYFKYVLEHKVGIYYVYGNEIYKTPEIFSSKESNSYLSAIELLAKYENPECKRQLRFIKRWLKENMTKNNEWDMGKESKDGINFPLSDTWKMEENRIKDCTYRINNLLKKI